MIGMTAERSGDLIGKAPVSFLHVSLVRISYASCLFNQGQIICQLAVELLPVYQREQIAVK